MTQSHALTKTWVKVAARRCMVQLTGRTAAQIHVVATGQPAPTAAAAYLRLTKTEYPLTIEYDADIYARATKTRAVITVVESPL